MDFITTGAPIPRCVFELILVATKDMIVIGASTGGIEALKLLVSELPKDFPASLFVVVHTGNSGPNALRSILQQSGQLPASVAKDWEEIKKGQIYVAPADYHLLLEPSGYMRLGRGPTENRFRPAIDPLFRSAAAAFGPRVIGIILTGKLDDGTAGLWAIRETGGTAIVQHPEEALEPSMPLNALKHVEVNHCIRISKMGSLLIELTRTPIKEGRNGPQDKVETKVRIV